MRIYLPATLPLLGRWLAAGEAVVDGDGSAALAYAVTPALREWYHEADLDELEHVAQVAASVGSLELLAADSAAPRRRVVIAVECPEDAVRPASGTGRSAVTATGAIPISRWASALVDDPAAQAVVSEAISQLGDAARGDDDAQFALDEAEAYELGWYAVQELRYLLD